VASLRRSYAQQRRNGLNAKLASIPGDKISEPALFLVRLGLWRGTKKDERQQETKYAYLPGHLGGIMFGVVVFAIEVDVSTHSRA